MQAVPMMMVTSGNRCGVLQSCCDAPPCRVASSCEGVKESRGSKGWCVSLAKRENVRLGGPTGKRSSHRNSPKPIHRGWAACVAGNCSSVSGPESGKGGRIAWVGSNPGVRLGKRNQARRERSWVKCYATGASGEIRKKESGSWGYGLKQSEARERSVVWKEGRNGEVGEPGGSEQVKQAHGAMVGNAISESEYEKVQDLRFSGDMWEGDSGPEVLDLQRALYWLGYLSKRTELTAYFGPETKKALQLFQSAHRVACSGAWGSSSRQALWKVLNEESRSFSEGGSDVGGNGHQAGSTSMKGVDAGGSDVGIRVSELVNNMGAHSRELISSLSSAPCWRHLPTTIPRNAAMFGLVVGMLAALLGVGYSVVRMFDEKHGQAVRRRVLRAHWRDDLSGTTSAKTRRHLDMFPGVDLPVVEGDYKYRLRSRWRPSSTNGAGRTDRLILYEGQVVVGDEPSSSVHPFLNGAASGRDGGKTGSQGPYRARTSSNEQVSRKAGSDGSKRGAGEENLQGSEMYSKRTSSVRIPGSRADRRSNSGGNGWQDKDEEDFKDRLQELRKSVQAAEKNRQAAMRALAEERQRSLELQVKISRQKETAAALEEEVRVLKESHDALLASLRKKYSSSVAARAAAALLYQNWDTSYEEGSPQTISD